MGFTRWPNGACIRVQIWQLFCVAANVAALPPCASTAQKPPGAYVGIHGFARHAGCVTAVTLATRPVGNRPPVLARGCPMRSSFGGLPCYGTPGSVANCLAWGLHANALANGGFFTLVQAATWAWPNGLPQRVANSRNPRAIVARHLHGLCAKGYVVRTIGGYLLGNKAMGLTTRHNYR